MLPILTPGFREILLACFVVVFALRPRSFSSSFRYHCPKDLTFHQDFLRLFALLHLLLLETMGIFDNLRFEIFFFIWLCEAGEERQKGNVFIKESVFENVSL